VTVFARVIDDKGRPGHVSAFMVRQGMKGVKVGPESLTMGVRSIMQNALILDDVAVDERHLVGEIGKGMELADEALLIARLCMGAISLGAMKRCAQLMLRYTARREVSTGRLIDSPNMRAVLSDATIRITAVQALLDRLTGILVPRRRSLHDRQDRRLQRAVGGRGRPGRNPRRARLHEKQPRAADPARLPHSADRRGR
jgi:alkylation response protein AidB-like acyl-CoA dehydrogenase